MPPDMAAPPDPVRRLLLLCAAAQPVALGAALSCCAVPPEQTRAFLTDIAGLLIPATGTPGADASVAGVADAVLKAVGVGQDDATPDMIDNVRAELDAALPPRFSAASTPDRYRALAAVDAQAYEAPFSNLAAHTAWRKIKGLILLAYYTSEIGASQELDYELVPGRFDPDVLVKASTKALSSDWFAVSFR